MTPEVRWREQRNVEWLPLVPAPGENRGFAETRVYLFEKPGDSWQLLVDDEPLDVDPAQPSCWRWQPGFFAGEVTAELRGHDEEGRCLFLLDVAPDDRKVGRELFQQMVDELWDADPALVIGEEPAQRQIGDLGAAQDPWLECASAAMYPSFCARSRASGHDLGARWRWRARRRRCIRCGAPTGGPPFRSSAAAALRSLPIRWRICP
jgi:hypothetical protein